MQRSFDPAHQFDPQGHHDLKQVINPSQFVSLSLGGTETCVVVKVLRSCLSRELVRCDRRCDRSRPTIEVQCSLAWLKSARYKIGHTLIATHLRVIVIVKVAIDLVSSSQCCKSDVWTVMRVLADKQPQLWIFFWFSTSFQMPFLFRNGLVISLHKVCGIN